MNKHINKYYSLEFNIKDGRKLKIHICNVVRGRVNLGVRQEKLWECVRALFTQGKGAGPGRRNRKVECI